MADTLTTQGYFGTKNIQIKIMDVSDGTGLSNYPVLASAGITPVAGPHLKIRRIRYSLLNLYLRVMWGGATPADIAYIGQGADELDFSEKYSNGYPNNAITPTGEILLTTSAQILGSGFTLELELIQPLPH